MGNIHSVPMGSAPCWAQETQERTGRTGPTVFRGKEMDDGDIANKECDPSADNQFSKVRDPQGVTGGDGLLEVGLRAPTLWRCCSHQDLSSHLRRLPHGD